MASPVMDEKKLTLKQNIAIEEHRLGIWRLKIATATGFKARQYLVDVKGAYPLLCRLVCDIYTIAPRLLLFFLLCEIWTGIKDALLMYLSSALLQCVEFGILRGELDAYMLTRTIILKLMCSVLVAYFAWHRKVSLATLRTRATSHFESYLLKAKLKVDLPTSQDPGSQQEVSAREALNALEEIMNFLTQLLTASSQLFLIANLSRTTGGLIFAILCVSKPVIAVMFSRSVWDKVSFGFIDNKYYRRLRALKDLVSGRFHQEIISGNLSEWISNEYEKTTNEIGEFTNENPYEVYARRKSPAFDIFRETLGDLPMVYCAISALLNPTKFSVASIAILQQSSTTLWGSLGIILSSGEQFRHGVGSIRKIYEASNVQNKMSDGSIPYPFVEEKKKDTSKKGMSFELRDVSFAYPGSQSITHALSNVSLTIEAGKVVCIVGSNGSGKSTIVRILARLYDPKSGHVLIDGRPCSDYRVDDLRNATAILSQDNLIYPLTLGENIGLGYPDCVSDSNMIAEAAEEGGASHFIKNLKNGMNTTLEPFFQPFQWNLRGNTTHPLYKEMEAMEKKINISGGEQQRVAAARAFMRFKSGKVKFVAVDEPSSALDAEGELELFNNLIKAREGKTMVFVTHRFGHLTKHADQIICMKDGFIAEMGTHEELMLANGEYAKLYSIQASAFSKSSVSN